MKQHVEKHASAIHPNPKVQMPTAKKKKVARSPIVLPTATSDPTPAAGSETQTASTAGATTTSTVADAPPNLTVPLIPADFNPVKLALYSGFRPKAGQLAAIPGAIAELQASEATLPAALGPNVPDPEQLATKLSIAMQWTSMRMALEAFLTYVMSNQAIAWKDGLTTLEQLGVIFDANAARNAQLAETFPKTAKLIAATKEIAQQGASTRSKKSKAKAKENAAIAATVATSGSAATPATTTPATAPAAAPATGGAAK